MIWQNSWFPRRSAQKQANLPLSSVTETCPSRDLYYLTQIETSRAGQDDQGLLLAGSWRGKFRLLGTREFIIKGVIMDKATGLMDGTATPK
jgi:hypothetical protein